MSVTLPAPPYSYETGKTSAPCNWKPGAGNGRHITGITIHHWGASSGLDFDGIVGFLCSPRPTNPTSAHYVAQGRDGHGNVSHRVACIVDPDDIAYACGSWPANLSQISIECRPECSLEDREVVAQLIARLRNQYGPLPLVGHQHWVADECPGSNWMANLAWLDQRANQILAGATAPTSAPAAPAPTQEDTLPTPADLWSYPLKSTDGKITASAADFLRFTNAKVDAARAENRAQFAALTAAVESLASQAAKDITPADVVATLDKAIRDRLAQLRFDGAVIDTAAPPAAPTA